MTDARRTIPNTGHAVVTGRLAGAGKVRVDGIVVLASDGGSPYADVLRTLCDQQGWPLVEVATGEAAGWSASSRKASLVVVASDDAPFVGDTVSAVRRSTACPLAVLGDLPVADRTRALAGGADAFLPSVADAEEMLVHLQALLRRSEAGDPTVRYLISGDLEVDLWGRRCQLAGTPVPLSRTEYDVLVLLMRHARRAVRLETIIQEVWRTRAYQLQTNAARIMISRVRTRLRSGAEGTAPIKSVRGVGYEFSAPVLEMDDGSVRRPGVELGRLGLASSLLSMASALRDRAFEDAARYVVDVAVADNHGDAVAVFRSRRGLIELVAERGHPEEYCRFMGSGVRERGRAEVHPDNLDQPVQIDDIARLGSRATSLRILAAHGFHSYLYIPLLADGRARGGLRLMSRSRRPLDPVMTMFCSAIAGLLSVKLPAEPPVMLATS
ncbi:MAG: hypothetical protein JWO98_4958 [Frankiales bacterium]|nr:hypothetical protein [Frankiales bacterium]